MEKIVIQGEVIEIYFYVGERHYKRELEISSSVKNDLMPTDAGKRYTSPLPVFHGKLEESLEIDFKPKKIYDAGSKTFAIGGLYWTRTSDLSHVKGTRYQLRQETHLKE